MIGDERQKRLLLLLAKQNKNLKTPSPKKHFNQCPQRLHSEVPTSWLRNITSGS